MPATYTSATLNSGFTQTQLYDFIKSSLVAAGFSVVSESGVAPANMILNVSYAWNATTYGTHFIQVTVNSSLSVSHNNFPEFNTGTGVGTNGAAGTTMNFNSAISYRSYHVQHTELRAVTFRGTNELGGFGSLRPATKPTWWNEALWPYWLLYGSSKTILSGVASARRPTSMGSATFGPSSGSSLNGANETTGLLEIFPAGFVTINSQTGRASWGGTFGSDVVLLPDSGLLPGDLFVDGASTFLLVRQGMGVKI